MLNFDGLTISQLKICYQMFANKATSFCSDKNPIKLVEQDGWTYYLIHHKRDNNYRILFHPVTLQPNMEPSAKDLQSLLTFCKENREFQSLNIGRIVIPIGEVSKPLLLPTVHHMVTLIVDPLPNAEPYLNSADVVDVSNIQLNDKSDQAPVYPSVQAKIIDSFRFSFPGCHQTEGILELLDNFYDVKSFKREYLSHQNWLDRHSCCYFTLKVIQKALEDPVLLGSIFTKSVPHPDTWISTSHNWLTLHNKREVHENLTEYFQKTAISNDESTEFIEEIVELD